jgi:hypothetical protein
MKYALPIVAVFAWAGPAPTAAFSDPPRLDATIHVNKKELDFWGDKSTREKYPEPTKAFFGQVAPTVGPYITSRQVKTFEGGMQIFSSISPHSYEGQISA